MMGLLYAVQGSFWPLLGVHLGEIGVTGRARGWIFASQALAAAAVPLGAGQLVDRLMPTQTFLVLAYALGALILAALASGWIASPLMLFAAFLAYWALIAPTNGLSSSLAMRNLAEPSREYAAVRLWGTVGWMAVGWFVSGVLLAVAPGRPGAGIPEAFYVAAGLSLVMAVFCRSLPHTPPLATAEPARASLRKGLDVLRDRDVRIYLVTAFGVYLTTPLVYQVMPGYLGARGLPRPWISTAMSLGQAPEVAALATLPWLLGRVGYKWTMAIGISAWLARFATLAIDPPLWLAVGGGVLHGVGYGCFTIGGQVFLDSRAPRTHRASVQAIFLVLTTGLGSLLGSLAAGEWIGRRGPGDDVLVFLFPCMINGALLVYFLTGFRSHVSTVDRAGATDADLPPRPYAVRGTVACVGNLVTESADG
jgi:MFS family permease